VAEKVVNCYLKLINNTVYELLSHNLVHYAWRTA